MPDPVEYTNLTEPKEIIGLTFTGVSLIIIVGGVIIVLSKKKLFRIYTLLLMIQISESLNCLARFLVFFKNREDKSADNIRNIIICQFQIFIGDFADFCTLSINSYVGIILYSMLKNGKNQSSDNKIMVIGIILCSIGLSALFVMINLLVNKNGCFYNSNYCRIDSLVNLFNYLVYIALIAVNIVFLYKSIKILEQSAGPNKTQESIEESSDKDLESDDSIGEDEDNKSTTTKLRNKIKNFIRKFITFIILFCILWGLLLIFNILDYLKERDIKSSTLYNVFDYIHVIIGSLVGVFYSYCYFFILTSYGMSFFKHCKCCSWKKRIKKETFESQSLMTFV